MDEDRVDIWFEREWPALERKLKEIPAAKEAAPHVDDQRVMAEVLRLAQTSANSGAKLRDELRDLREILAAKAGKRRRTPWKRAGEQRKTGDEKK